MAFLPGLPGWASTRKVKPIWILLKQETVSGSGITWDICMSASRSRQITTPAPHNSVFSRPDALPAAQPTASKHWRHHMDIAYGYKVVKISLWRGCTMQHRSCTGRYILGALLGAVDMTHCTFGKAFSSDSRYGCISSACWHTHTQY